MPKSRCSILLLGTPDFRGICHTWPQSKCRLLYLETAILDASRRQVPIETLFGVGFQNWGLCWAWSQSWGLFVPGCDHVSLYMDKTILEAFCCRSHFKIRQKWSGAQALTTLTTSQPYAGASLSNRIPFSHALALCVAQQKKPSSQITWLFTGNTSECWKCSPFSEHSPPSD
jgi:hypothetical protein